MRPQIVKLLTSVLCIFTSTIMLAQQKSGDTGPPPPSTPPPELPIDGGVIILLTIGFIYGCYIAVKRLRVSYKLD